METGLYVGLSGQLALQRRLDTIANNVANSTTPGFRAENVTFESIVSRQHDVAVAYANKGATSFSQQSGPVVQTGNSLDVAIQGKAFLALGSPSGMVYTRDGRMTISANGDLQSMTGQPILDQGGAPIQINAARGPVQIARNGVISQNGDQVGTIGLFSLPPNASISRRDGSAFASTVPAEPVTDFNETGLAQGYIEQANVNPVLEMSRLIAVTRAFEAISSSIEQSDRKLSDAVRTLGSGRGS